MRRPLLLGLTGSIGMGKSTTAAMFAAAGVPVWDADAAVHRIYGPGGAAVAPVGAAFPEAIEDGAVSRERLRAALGRDGQALARLERIVHPLLADDRAAFIADCARSGAPLAVFDVPLLFETGLDTQMDATLVVTTAPEVQRARVLERPGMTEAQFETLLARQMPDAEKRARADHVIETRDLDQTRAAVQALIRRLQGDRDA